MKHQYLKNVTTLWLDRDKCRGCGMCAVVCPHNVFDITDGKAQILDKDYCIECGACMQNCPFGAIAVETGTGCAYAVIRSMFTKKKPSCDEKAGKKSCC